MSEGSTIYTLEEAVEWCAGNEVHVHFGTFHDRPEVAIYSSDSSFLGSGVDLIEAVNDAIAGERR